MKCNNCFNEVPDDTLICMYCGQIVQTEQERDERIRKKAEDERLEAERLEAEKQKARKLKAEQLKKEQQEKERLKKEQLKKMKQQQRESSTSVSGEGQVDSGNDKKKKVLVVLGVLAIILIWKLAPAFKGEDKDTSSAQTQNADAVDTDAVDTDAADTDTADAAPAESAQSTDNSTESTANAMGTVTGKVVDENSGAAIEGARIVFTDEDGTIFPQDDVLKSDKNGSFTINVPAGGRYMIKITRENYLEATFGYAEVEADEMLILDNLGIEKDSAQETQAQETQTDTGEYILPYSNSRYLTDADLDRLSEWELKLARNEIYARHGRRFKDPELQSYFDKKSWYNGIYDPTDFDKNHGSDLSTVEKQNAEYILQYEKDHNYFT